MNTLEEISSCPIANRKFWTDQARFNLVCAKENQGADRNLEIAAFRKNMAHRRAETHLEPDQ